MQLLRPNELPSDDSTLVFRYSRARVLLASGAALASAIALVVVGWSDHRALASYLAAVILLTLLLARRSMLARFHFSNWLLRVDANGLVVNLRSYLNHHFSAVDRTVVRIPFREVRAAREIHETRSLPDADSRTGRLTTMQRRRLVELELSADSTALARALTDERARPAPSERRWYGLSHTKYHHYPVVLVSPTILEIEWRAVPGAGVFLDAIRRHVPVDPPVQRSRDYSSPDPLDREEQQQRLRELALSGLEVEAIRLARRLHGYDLAEAKELVRRIRAEEAAPSRRRAG